MSKHVAVDEDDVGIPMSDTGDGYVTRSEVERMIAEAISGIRKETRSRVFERPTVEMVTEYCVSRRNGVDPQKFVDHYEANGWKVGRNAMKDWRAAVRTWEKTTPTGDRPTPRDSSGDDESPTDGVRYAKGHEPPWKRKGAS